MPPNQPFVQFDSSGMRPESMFTFIAFTAGFLLVAWLVNKRSRPLGVSLIMWGIMVEILAVGYGMISVPSVVLVTPALTKIGFLLVLGGIAASLFASCPVPPEHKEADHV